MSIAAMSGRWLRRKLRQVGEGPPRHPAPDRGLADVDAKLEQLPVNAWGTPQRVGVAHAADQITDFWTDPGPSRTPRSPAPIEPEALAMPLDHGCGLDQYDRVDDLGPDPVEQHP